MVDNGSSDGTAEALRALGDERLTVVARDVPLGAAKARNVGIAAARTAWVAFLDNDDLWAPTKLDLQLQALGDHPSARWCRHRVRLRWWRPDCATWRAVDRGAVGTSRGAASQQPGAARIAVTGQRHSRRWLLGPGRLGNWPWRRVVSTTTCRAARTGTSGCAWLGCRPWSTWTALWLPGGCWEGQGSGDARMMLRSANLVRTKYFPDLGPLDRQYAQIWWASAARRQLSRKHRVQASRQFLQLARIGRAARPAWLRSRRRWLPLHWPSGASGGSSRSNPNRTRSGGVWRSPGFTGAPRRRYFGP